MTAVMAAAGFTAGWVTASPLYAQSVRGVHGRVVDAKTRAPLEGAELSIAEGATTRSGTDARLTGTWLSDASRLKSTLALSQLNHMSRTGPTTDPINGTGDRQLQRLGEADMLYTHRSNAAVIDFGAQVHQEYIMSTDGRIAGGLRTIARPTQHVPIRVTAALDNAPQLARVLSDHAKALATDPAHQALFVVGQ